MAENVYLNKAQIYFYTAPTAAKQSDTETKYKVRATYVTPSSISCTYQDDESTSQTWNKYGYTTKSTVKKGKKKKIKKAKHYYTVNGKANKTCLTGYKTSLTISFNFLTETQLRTLLRNLRQRTKEVITYSGTYKDKNGKTHKQTKKKTVYSDSVMIAYYDVMANCFCKTKFNVSDTSFSTSFKKNGEFWYQGVSITLTSVFARSPKGIYSAVKSSTYWFQNTSTGKWINGKEPTYHHGYI